MGKSRSCNKKQDDKPSTPKALKAATPRIAKRDHSTVVEEAVPEAQPADEVITVEEPSKVSPARRRGTPEPAEVAVPPEPDLPTRFMKRLREMYPELVRHAEPVINPHARPGCDVFERFMRQLRPGVPLEDQVELVLHGTAGCNIDSILQNALNVNPPYYVTTHIPTALSYATRRDATCRRLVAFLGVKSTLSGHAAYPHQWIYTTHSVVLPLFVTTVGPPLLPHLG